MLQYDGPDFKKLKPDRPATKTFSDNSLENIFGLTGLIWLI